jgi:hypothetical protein
MMNLDILRPETALPPSRRSFLANASALLIGSIVPRGMAEALQKQATPGSVDHKKDEPDHGLGPNPTADATLKFEPDGRPKPFAGNTVIAHIPAQGAFRDGTVRLHDALAGAAFAHKLAILPTDSYHMTIFNGSNDLGRTNSTWPGGVLSDASIDQCNRVMLERMKETRLKAQFPIQVSIDMRQTLEYGRACTLRMIGSTEMATRNLLSIRQQLAAAYRVPVPANDDYEFHITFAYTMHDFADKEKTEYKAILQEHLPKLIASAPNLELGLAEYCTFPNMYRFDIQHLVGVV